MTATPLRVLFVNEAALHGAHVMGTLPVERALVEAVRRRDDVEGHFVSLAPSGPAARLLARGLPLLDPLDLDLQPLRWHLVNGAVALRLVRNELAQFKADVVHVNTQAIAMLMARQMRRRPFFVSVDATAWAWHRLDRSRRLHRHSRILFAPSAALERRTFRHAHTIVAWTAWARNLVQDAVPDARVVELNPGIDLKRFRPADRVPRERPRLLFVGGRFDAKGGFDLLAAVRHLLGTEVELDVVTPAPVPATPGVHVHRLSPADERLVSLYQQADLFCLPTYADTMGWAIIEAMACGTPVIATPVGAIPEVIGGDQAGMTVEPGDVASLRTAIEELLADDARRSALGAAARARCERVYDARRQTASLIELMNAAASR
jgi:glycosyltransferase involved in cell wall biosynthesis